DVRKLFGHVDGQLIFMVFAASGAEQPPKLPLLRTPRTEQKPLTSVALWAQDAGNRQRIAARAAADRHCQRRGQHAAGEMLRIRLQESAKEKMVQHRGGIAGVFFVGNFWSVRRFAETG